METETKKLLRHLLNGSHLTENQFATVLADENLPWPYLHQTIIRAVAHLIRREGKQMPPFIQMDVEPRIGCPGLEPLVQIEYEEWSGGLLIKGFAWTKSACAHQIE